MRKHESIPAIGACIMTSKPLVLRVYRTLLRQAKNIYELELRKPLTKKWGYHEYSATGLEYQGEALQMLVPSLSRFPGAEVLTSDIYKQVVRQNFALHKAVTSQEEQASLIDQAFVALRALLEQQYLQACSSSRATNGVRVDVTSKFDKCVENFNGQPLYVFTYRVRVTNSRPDKIKVLGRSWTIKDDRGSVVVHIPLDDNALVGQQPVIPPGHCFEYYSGTDIPTPAGLQTGSLLVECVGQGTEKTERIEVNIAPFPLLMPART